MPEIFSPHVYKAVAQGRPQVLARLTPQHFESYTKLNEALGWLSAQELCDAVYGDWLDAINSQAGPTLLQMRRLLINQGGLAANYLAEFAQNADDAYEGSSGGEIRIWAPPGWLLVANNGRQLNGTDLLGLCRFFANGSKIEATSEALIGKFGIGFKSCYRIGTEVWVHTWAERPALTFRIPLCRGDAPKSHYDAETFQRVLGLIGRSNARTSQDELGFCTPEFANALPIELHAALAAAREHAEKQGTFFAIRLHEEGESAFRQRLKNQSEQIFELCPLFVRRLRLTQLEETSLRLVVHRESKNADIPGVLDAEQVTLEAQGRIGNKSNARFWRLTQTHPKPWRLALHADSRFFLNLKKEDEETTSLSDGAAYAFFPLGISWPFNVHLHLDLPTNLDRSSWSPDQPAAIEAGLCQAAAGLCTWLEANQERWHASWCIADLIKGKPTAPPRGLAAPPEYRFFLELREQVRRRRLIRSVWGTFVSGEAAQIVPFRESSGTAWHSLADIAGGLSDQYCWCSKREGEIWDLPCLSSESVVNAIIAWPQPRVDPGEYGRRLLAILVQIAGLQRRDWEKVLKSVPISETLSVRELFELPGGYELPREWHDLFKRLAKGVANEEWAETSVGSHSLWKHFERFSRPCWNPDWSTLPKVLHPGIPLANVDDLWSAEKLPCPAELSGVVCQSLLARSASDQLTLISELWVWGRTVPEAFRGVFSQVNPSRQASYIERLSSWRLADTCREQHLARAKRLLPTKLAAILNDAMQSSASFLPWLDAFQKQLREFGGRELDWRDLLEAAGREAVSAALTLRSKLYSGQTLLSQSIDPDLRAVIAWHNEYTDKALWLDDQVLKRFTELRWDDLLVDLPALRSSAVIRSKADILRKLLEIAHIWPSKNPTAGHYAALQRLGSDLSKTERRAFMIGTSAKKRRGLDEFITLSSETPDPNSHWLRETPDFADKMLPANVARVPALAEVCPRLAELTLKAEDIPASVLLLPLASLPADLAQLGPIKALLDHGKIDGVCEHRPICLSWWDGDRKIAATERAKFYYQKESRCLFVTRLALSVEDHQVDKVLGNYLENSAQDPEVDAAWQEAKRQGRPLYAVYTQFRDRIRAALVHAHVTKMGYETGHIWRELLQNAENAYISMEDPRPLERPFEFQAIEESGGTWRVSVTNRGRRFDHSDRQGNARRDVDRIISLGGERVQVAEEIGRYNLGFKSVFSVTDAVDVVSGGLEFQILDLLLRFPAHPIADPSHAERPTTFSWKCTRANLDRILGLGPKSGRAATFSVLSPPYVLFGRYVNRLVLRMKDTVAEVRVERTSSGNHENVTVHGHSGSADRFLVLRGTCPLGTPATFHHFAAAVRIDAQGDPTPAKEHESYFHLTYPTDERSFVPFIVDADFEPEGVDRRQLRKQSRRNLSLLLSATKLVAEHATQDLNTNISRERWKGWVRVLAPRDLEDGVKANYEEGVSEATRVAGEIKTKLLQCVPHRNEPHVMATLVFPTTPLRKFAARHGPSFGIDTEDWIDESVAPEVDALGWTERFKLTDWLNEQWQNETQLGEIDDALQDFSDFTPQERFEVSAAREAVTRRLQRAPCSTASLSLEQLADWWEKHGTAQPYTLEGDLFAWVRGADFSGGDNSDVRREYVRTRLNTPGSDEGRAVWYRLLTYACLISAGHSIETTNGFLEELSGIQFFTRTARPGADFSGTTEEIFRSLVQRRHTNDAAAGEDAHFWRHIFYDARKVHHLVYTNDFAEVFLDLCRDARRGEALLQFLRSGKLPGQPAWHGVLGQSAAAPLFFVVRELRRLGVITHSQADSGAFFVCKPVRRTCAELGWIEDGMVEYPRFTGLIEISRIILERYRANAVARQVLLPYFDIPLLAYRRPSSTFRL